MRSIQSRMDPNAASRFCHPRAGTVVKLGAPGVFQSTGFRERDRDVEGAVGAQRVEAVEAGVLGDARGIDHKMLCGALRKRR